MSRFVYWVSTLVPTNFPRVHRTHTTSPYASHTDRARFPQGTGLTYNGKSIVLCAPLPVFTHERRWESVTGTSFTEPEHSDSERERIYLLPPPVHTLAVAGQLPADLPHVSD